MQKVMIVQTRRDNMRAEIDGWILEDGDEASRALAFGSADKEYRNITEVPVSAISTRSATLYPTVLHALGEGWTLLAPPREESRDASRASRSYFVWWLVKD